MRRVRGLRQVTPGLISAEFVRRAAQIPDDRKVRCRKDPPRFELTIR